MALVKTTLLQTVGSHRSWIPIVLTLSRLITQIATDRTMANIINKAADISNGTCNARIVDAEAGKIVCVCDEHNCNVLKFTWPDEQGKALLVESTKAGKRFNVSLLDSRLLSQSDHKLNTFSLTVNLSRRFQSIMGWGGAFTDATGSNLIRVSEKLADMVMESYYGEDGLQYNFGRVPIAGTDFSSRPYSYDDSPEPDLELKNWTLTQEDTKLKIPFIKKAMNLVKNRESSDELKLFASPWSPPKWMKRNDNFVRGSLVDEDRMYRSYAEYLMKFYDAYKEQGINFWGATVQNEPVAAYLPFYFFNSLQFGNEQMIKFITKYLGPALEARGYTKESFKLMIGDDSLGFVNLQVPALLRHKEVQKYVSGVAFHWYTSGLVVPYSALNRLYDSVKGKVEFILMSEACTGPAPSLKKVDLGSWERGEAYATDIIEDLVRHTAAWIDWNMALDLGGGPNWSGNFVDSPILVDGPKNEFYKQPMYYALAHFSRFFKPGSVRVETRARASRRWGNSDKILAVAVHNNQTGHLSVNILNKSKDRIRIEVAIDGLENDILATKLKTLVVEGKSINTIVLKL